MTSLRRITLRLLGRPTSITEANQRRLHPTDTVLASYPRSGNTWMRLLLADVLLQTHGVATSTSLPIPLRAIIPDYEADDINAVDPRFAPPRRILKSHQLEVISGRRVIYVYRDCADALCSFHHFSMKNNLEPATDIDSFCEAHLDEWLEHHRTILDAKSARPAEVHLVSYETLHENAAGALEKALRFLGVEATAEMIGRAIANQTFDKLKTRQAEEASKGTPFKYPFRKGVVGSASEELKPPVLARIHAASHDVMERARELEAGDSLS